MENDNHSIVENGELRVMERLKAAGFCSTVFDVGANIGEYSIQARRCFPKSDIYAFEPIRRTYVLLCQNTEGTGIRTFNFGLGDRDESLEFSLLPDALGLATAQHSIVRLRSPDAERVREQCQIRRSGDVATECGVAEIGLLKIDTEGNDWFVLHGFEEWQKAGRIKIIQFEYGLFSITTKKLLFDFYELLTSYGYKIGKIYPTCVDFRDYNPLQEDFIGPNFLGVHESFDSSIFK